MAQRFKIGDRVSWNSEAGRVRGKIVHVHTKDLYACGDIALMPENQGFLGCCGSSYFPCKARAGDCLAPEKQSYRFVSRARRIAYEIDPPFDRHEIDDGLVLRRERFDLSSPSWSASPNAYCAPLVENKIRASANAWAIVSLTVDFPHSVKRPRYDRRKRRQ